MTQCGPPTHPAFLVNREAGKRWRAAQTTAPEAHPAPQVPARVASAEEVPRGAQNVARAAERAGWHVVVTYARGTRLGANGRPLGVPCDSVAVRCSRGPAKAWAVWINPSGAKWDAQCAYGWRAGEWPAALSSEGLRAWLQSEAS